MKRLLSLLFLVMILPLSPSVASAATPSYALIGENGVLYADEARTIPVCSLEPNYFVTVLSETSDVFRVGYCDLVGYVPTSCVKKVDYTPQSVYPSLVAVTVSNDGNSVTLRSAPTHEDKNEIKRITSGSKVIYYGRVTGSAQVAPVGNEWYYVKIGEQYGYVYSLYLTPPVFPPNDTSPLVLPTPEVSSDWEMDEKGRIALIVLLCLSAFFLAFLWIKNGKKKRTA